MVRIAPPVKGFNKYKVNGEITTLYLERRDGTIIEALIDTEDLERLIELGYRWYSRYAKNTNTYYVQTTAYFGDEGHRLHTSYHLNTIIMNCPKGKNVDHINHDTLDNRKENLRIITVDKNTKNRKSKNSNNTSGYRNVLWDKNKNIWVVSLRVNGKSKYLKCFKPNELEQAGAFAEQMRQKYYGEFAGNN